MALGAHNKLDWSALNPRLVSLLSPKDLVGMSAREVEIMNHSVEHEIQTNQQIRSILSAKLAEVRKGF